MHGTLRSRLSDWILMISNKSVRIRMPSHSSEVKRRPLIHLPADDAMDTILTFQGTVFTNIT